MRAKERAKVRVVRRAVARVAPKMVVPRVAREMRGEHQLLQVNAHLLLLVPVRLVLPGGVDAYKMMKEKEMAYPRVKARVREVRAANRRGKERAVPRVVPRAAQRTARRVDLRVTEVSSKIDLTIMQSALKQR